MVWKLIRTIQTCAPLNKHGELHVKGQPHPPLAFQLILKSLFIIYFGSLRKNKKDENWICWVFIQSHITHIRTPEQDTERKLNCVLNDLNIPLSRSLLDFNSRVYAKQNRVANFRFFVNLRVETINVTHEASRFVGRWQSASVSGEKCFMSSKHFPTECVIY